MRRYLCVYNENDIGIEMNLFRKAISSGLVKKRSVYNNMFNIVRDYWNILESLGCKVAYAYLKVGKNVFMRTIVFVKDGKIIDINRQFYKNKEKSNYYVYKEDSLLTYINAVLDTKGDVSLKKYLKEDEDVWKECAFKNFIDIKE